MKILKLSGLKKIASCSLLILCCTTGAQETKQSESLYHYTINVVASKKGKPLIYYKGTVRDVKKYPFFDIKIENQVTCETVRSDFDGEFSFWGHPGDTVMFTSDYSMPKEVTLGEIEKFEVTLEEIPYCTEIIYDRNMPVYTQRRMAIKEIEAINKDNKDE